MDDRGQVLWAAYAKYHNAMVLGDFILKLLGEEEVSLVAALSLW